jgi:uncharacterized RDD family membrane protein YckC
MIFFNTCEAELRKCKIDNCEEKSVKEIFRFLRASVYTVQRDGMSMRARDSYSNVSEDVHRVELPEHVEIGFTLAGFGSRFIAYLVDLICMIVFVVILFAAILALLIVLQGGMYTEFVRGPSPRVEGLVIAVVISLFGLALFVVSWFYFVLFEMLWEGKSPGKRLVGIRVIRDEGGRISFSTSLLRNLLRVADWLPAFYLVGIITMFANKKWKRLGDLTAGTVVVKEEKAGWRPSFSVPPPVLSSAQDDPSSSIHIPAEMLEKLGKDYYNLCRDFLGRRERIDPQKGLEIEYKIAGKPMRRLGLQAVEPIRFIEAFVLAWRQKKG